MNREQAALHLRYVAEKKSWLRQHPYATPNAIEQAARAIARRLGL